MELAQARKEVAQAFNDIQHGLARKDEETRNKYDKLLLKLHLLTGEAFEGSDDHVYSEEEERKRTLFADKAMKIRAFIDGNESQFEQNTIFKLPQAILEFLGRKTDWRIFSQCFKGAIGDKAAIVTNLCRHLVSTITNFSLCV